MDNTKPSPDPESRGPRLFPSTHWSVVMRAGRGSSETACDAFERLYLSYRTPVLAFLRRSGHAEDSAEDLAQGFFAYLLAGHGLAKVAPTGRFRNWLVTCLKNFVNDQRIRAGATKRGGHVTHVPVGTEEDEGMVDPAQPGRTPEQEFDRQFALQFLEQLMAQLRHEYQLRGRDALFDRLQPLLLDKKSDEPQTDIARDLGTSVGSINQEVTRLRRRFRDLFDRELGKLIGDQGDLADEKRFLLGALRA